MSSPSYVIQSSTFLQRSLHLPTFSIDPKLQLAQLVWGTGKSPTLTFRAFQATTFSGVPGAHHISADTHYRRAGLPHRLTGTVRARSRESCPLVWPLPEPPHRPLAAGGARTLLCFPTVPDADPHGYGFGRCFKGILVRCGNRLQGCKVWFLRLICRLILQPCWCGGQEYPPYARVIARVYSIAGAGDGKISHMTFIVFLTHLRFLSMNFFHASYLSSSAFGESFPFGATLKHFGALV